MGGVEGAAWSLSGDAFTDWDTIQRTCNPGGYGPSAVRPSLCHGLSCLLPFPGQAPGGGGGPSRPRQAWALGGTGGWGRHSPSFHLCRGRGGTGTPLVCRLLGPTALSRGKGCSGFRGRWTPGGRLWSSSPNPPAVRTPRSRGFAAASEVACIPLRDPRQVGRSPPRLHLRPR